MSHSEHFPVRLRKHREREGWTQKQLGDLWGVSPETISAWEHGRRKPDVTLVSKVASELKMAESELIAYISANSPKVPRIEEERIALDEFEHRVFRSQQSCESYIREASQQAKRIRILTIRGDNYFVGTRSLLHNAIDSMLEKDLVIEALVLSPDAEHITEELAGKLQHHSAVEIREKMRRALQYLKALSSMYITFSVRYYKRKPIFKILIFDDIMFVSSFAVQVPKNDQSAEMHMIKRGTSLFAGFEVYYNELWEVSPELD